MAIHAEPTNTANVPFDIHWPLANQDSNYPALLIGSIGVEWTNTETEGGLLKLELTLTRPQGEAQRQFWNKSLAFPEYDWMHYVRVWDTNNQWLWPNLPFLLRLYGRERIERYGGWDPGKNVDNDFAAVLIRKYNARGTELPETQRRPLVSGEWHAVGVKETEKQTLVHSARSDQFTVHLDNKEAAGRIMVWLVYGDFLGAPVPRDWPKEPEHDGGILAFFQIEWKHGEQGYAIEAKQKVPPHSTGFDWRRWVARYSFMDQARGTCRLTDR